MRLSISNIAWDTSEDESIASLLKRYAVDAVDIAPGKYFSDIKHTSNMEILEVRNWWQARGIEITGMQALLFGTTGLNIFGTEQSRKAMLDHLEHVCRIGRGLGAKWLVFGSPKNRDRADLSDKEAREIAVPFFQALGERAAAYGVVICLEPTPPHYSGNFMIDSAETADIVKCVGHNAIRMQCDTGAITLNHEDIQEITDTYAGLIGHIHASEPDLLTLGEGATQHAVIAPYFKQHFPDKTVCIEMLAKPAGENYAAVEQALQFVRQYY